MVIVAMYFSASDLAAKDGGTIGGLVNVDAHGAQARGHGSQSVGFLDPQLRRTAYRGLAFRTGRCDEQCREFVTTRRTLSSETVLNGMACRSLGSSWKIIEGNGRSDFGLHTVGDRSEERRATLDLADRYE
jgi:hypothetical protein